MSWLARAWAHRKLARGQCRMCRAVLRDDATEPTCSDLCAEALFESMAW